MSTILDGVTQKRKEEMATDDTKRFYWLKLPKAFFEQHKLKILKAMPNGRLYALIYLELLAESVTHDGELRFSETLPYDSITLAAVIGEDKDNLEKAIEALERLELVEILDDQTIYMKEINKMIGSEMGSAERQRKHREKLKCDNVTRLSQKCHQEIRDKSKEIRDKSKEKYKGISNADVVDAFKDFESMRNKMKKPLTDKARTRIINRLNSLAEKDNEKILILQQSTDHCWQDVYELKEKEKQRIDRTQDYSSINNETDMDALDRFLNERKS